MKKMMMILVAMVSMMFVMPVSACVAHVEADRELKSFQMEAASNYGLDVSCGDWINANGADWRKVYVEQSGERIAILLQWESTPQVWLTFSTEKQHLRIGDVLNRLSKTMKPTVVKTAVNAKMFGFKLAGSARRIIVRELNANGQLVRRRTLTTAKAGWQWLARHPRSTSAVVTAYGCNGRSEQRNIKF